MIAALFLNPGFLLIGIALISVPIIIHLINRMRFKRIRWAAMEFLLKAQKRTRRRLIIEQLLLLALRCFLIFLILLLVSRFVGCGDSNTGGKPNLHLVLLDDTLSMQDQVKAPDGAVRSCFDVAKQDFLIKKIVKGLSLSKTNDQLMIVPLSKVDDPEYLKTLVFANLNTPDRKKAAEDEINKLEPTALHVNMVEAIKLAKRVVGEKSDSRVTLHILSDFRFTDWSGKPGEAMYKELLDMVRENEDMKIRPIDTVFPARGAGFPPSNDNVGIVSIRPSTRIVGHRMLVHFIVTIANFSGKQVDVEMTARNETTGKDMLQVDFDLQGDKKDKTRIRLSPSALTEVTFDYGDLKHGLFFDVSPKPGEPKFAHLSVRLTNAAKADLENDGLLIDNIRHTVVEVRDKVPILIVDGDGSKSRNEKDSDGKDSFILERSLSSITGSNYQLEFGYILGKGNPAAALEVPDLAKYPTIFIANLRELNVKQLSNLENFVKEGGGVAFYVGPNVNAQYYNKFLYKDGQGVFPVPLKNTYYPPSTEPELKDKDADTEQLLIREDKFAHMSKVPIFKNIFDDPRQRVALRHLPIRRYFKVDRPNWKQDPSHEVKELATLPNENPAGTFDTRVADITINGPHLPAILGKKEFEKYGPRLREHVKNIQDVVRRDAAVDYKAYHLASRIQALLTDRGSAEAVPPIPDMTELWDNGDESVQALKRNLVGLREDVNYGDPFIIAQKFGKGKVVAILSTVGKDWNDWCGGCMGSVVFQPFIWEMQNHLSSPDDDANLTVGSNLEYSLDADLFKGANLKLVRKFLRTAPDKDAVFDKETVVFGKTADSKVAFSMTKHHDPGRYEYELFDENQPGKSLAKFSHAFNVDTMREGQLQRVGSDEMERELIAKAVDITKNKDVAEFIKPGMADEALIAKQNDFSESPWLFLILLLVLVAEQALAVHLSFHLKNADDAAMKGVRA